MTDRRRARLRLGPGLITGACNDDPSSVATYSQVGAQFGFGLAWTLPFSFPLLVAIQEISARIGRVTGLGLAGNLRRHYPGWLAAALVTLLSLANVFNLAADLGAMGEVLKLLVAGPALLYVCLFGVIAVLLELLTGYARYVRLLRWLCLSLLSYVACAFVVAVPWRQLGHALLWPPLSASPHYVLAVVAALGTTISPYLLFWQAQQEVEDGRHNGGEVPLRRAVEQAPGEFARIRFDTLVGMGLSSVVALFIVITTASTLHAQGAYTIQTAAEAAEALRAVGGRFTFVLFALGILGAGMLTLPALSISSAYALGELLSWRVGRLHPRGHTRAFSSAIAAATALAVALNFTPMNPIRALYWSAVLNGVIAVPLMAAVMHMATRGDGELTGALQLPPSLRALGWLATAAMAGSVAALLIAWLAFA
jgi:NRAMP (natural resistance-associated macrophage protein)-like metal ion transporter